MIFSRRRLLINAQMRLSFASSQKSRILLRLMTTYLSALSLPCTKYKIIAKVLAARLKKVLPLIIHDSQAAFVEGHQILDAILVASETVGHWKKEKKKGFLLKLDFEKAYDKVDWLSLLRC